MKRALPLLLLSLIFGCAALRLSHLPRPSANDWIMYGKDASHTHYVPSSSFAFPMNIAWQYDASAGFGAGAMSVVDGTLLVGTLQGELHAVNAVTGKRLGYRKFSAPISGSPFVFEDYVYFGLEAGKESFLAFDLTVNKTIWSSTLGGIAASPVVYDGKIFVATLAGNVHCLVPLSGEEIWKFGAGGAIHSSPVVVDSTVVFGNDNGVIYGLNIRTGTLVWQYQTGAAIFGGASAAGGLVFIGSRDHFLYALDVRKGSLVWKYDAGDRIVSCPSVNDSTVFITALNGSLTALRQHNGAVLWKFQTSSALNTTAVVTRSALFLASLNTELYALSPSDGSVLWKHKFENRVKTSPVVWNNSLYIGAEDRLIYCFRSAGSNP